MYRGGHTSRGTTKNGLQHWDREIRNAEKAIQESAAIAKPYEAVLAAERAVSAIDLIRNEIDKMPSGQFYPGIPANIRGSF